MPEKKRKKGEAVQDKEKQAQNLAKNYYIEYICFKFLTIFQLN